MGGTSPEFELVFSGLGLQILQDRFSTLFTTTLCSVCSWWVLSAPGSDNWALSFFSCFCGCPVFWFLNLENENTYCSNYHWTIVKHTHFPGENKALSKLIFCRLCQCVCLELIQIFTIFAQLCEQEIGGSKNYMSIKVMFMFSAFLFLTFPFSEISNHKDYLLRTPLPNLVQDPSFAIG